MIRALVLFAVYSVVTTTGYLVYPTDYCDSQARMITSCFLGGLRGVKHLTAYNSLIRGVTEIWLVDVGPEELST